MSAPITAAQKFEPKVMESFKKHSYTDRAVNHNYNFNGVKTISVYNVETSPMKNYGYSRTSPSQSRYGDIANLGGGKVDYTLRVDRSFTFAIDKMDDKNAMNVLNPGKALQRQVEQRIIPEVDKYRLARIVDDKNEVHDVATGTLDKTNAYTSFLDAVGTLLEKQVPMEGTFAYIGTEFYKAIRLDENFIKASDMAQEMRLKGVVGSIEGIPLVHVPDSYFPTSSYDGAHASGEAFGSFSNLSSKLSGKKINFILMNKEAVLGAEKLVDYKIHDNPPGINGWLVEGRMVYDCFLLDGRQDMVYVSTRTNP